MPITLSCVYCKKPQEIPVTVEQVIAWRKGKNLIQNVFPELTPGQREMLISGTCDDCWKEMFKEEGESR